MLYALVALALAGAAASTPRAVRVQGTRWINVSSGEQVMLKGPNVVVKGPPWLPRVEGTTVCHDTSTATCYTFNEADARHIKETMGYNLVRLGVAWPGAQPDNGTSFDPTFIANLQAILRLCEAHGISVILDMHGDMVSTANCGWGMPAWLAKLARPELIGKPLTQDLPYRWISSLTLHSACGDNETAWAQHAGDPNYNLLNECCVGLNAGANNNAVGFTTLAQGTMDYMLYDDAGKAAFANFWGGIAAAVADYPAAIGVELMNEPMTIHRPQYFELWRAADTAIRAHVPDMSVGVMDIGEGAVFPSWVMAIAGDLGLSSATTQWLTSSQHLFYAWHWYGNPSDPRDAVAEVQTLMSKWGVASMLSETMSCTAIRAAEAVNMSWSYWHYSRYCDTAPAFGSKLPPNSFGACILGWDGGDSSKSCSPTASASEVDVIYKP